MGDDVITEEKRKSKGRGRGLTLRTSNDTGVKVGAVASKKDKEVEDMDEPKDEKEWFDENSKQRGTKVRKTRAGFEPYQVKKSRPLNTSSNSDINKIHSGGEKDNKQSQVSSHKRSGSAVKHDYHKGNEKYHDKTREQKAQTNSEQKILSQNKLRPNNNNNKRNNYRTYTNKEKQKQSRRKKVSNENMTPINDRLNNKKNSQGSADLNSLNIKSTAYICENINEQILGVCMDKADLTCTLTNAEENANTKFRGSRIPLDMENNDSIEDFKKLFTGNLSQLSDTDTNVTYDDTNSQTDRIELTESESLSTQVNLFTEEEIDILKEIDNNRRARGLGILECPCSLGLDGERVGYCDAHELIAEHHATINTAMSSEEVHFDTDKESTVVDKEWDPSDEMYLTVSPFHVDDDDAESNLPSDVEIAEIHPPSDRSCEEISSPNESINLKNPEHVSQPCESDSFNTTNVYSLDKHNESTSCNDSANFSGSFNSTGVCSDEFSSPMTLETSRNIDIENINALFKSIAISPSDNISCRSNSLGSKTNLSCEKTWRSMEDFSPIDLRQSTRKSSSIISVSSDTSGEAINSTKDTEVDRTNYTTLSKSDSSMPSVSMIGESTVSDKLSSPRSYPSLCDSSRSPHLNPTKKAEKTSTDDCIIEDEGHLIVSNENKILKERRLKSIVDILNSNKTLEEKKKKGKNDKRMLFHSYSGDNENECKKFPQDNEDKCKIYSEKNEKECMKYADEGDEEEEEEEEEEEGKNLICVDIEENNVNCENKGIFHSGKQEEPVIVQGKNEEKGNNGSTSSKRSRPDSPHRKSNDSTSDVRNVNDKNCEKLNVDDGVTCADKTSGLITVRNMFLIPKSSSREKEEGASEGGGRRIRFSSQGSDSRFSTSSSKHDDDSYMVREYMNTIKDKQFQLKKLLQRGFQSLESVNVMLAMSEAIQQKFGELIVHNQEYSFRHNFENSLWKLAFYSIIAKFRAFLEDQDVPHAAVQKIGVLYWDFLQNGIQFLDAIIVQLQKQANFDLNSYLKDPIKITCCNKQVKFALRSCHLLLIFMGDLERYVSQFLQEDDYHNAKRYYKQAQILTPKNGKSYNQLAVIAVVTKHKLDAVYYYARSLQVSIPFLTAKDRLTAIFQEIQKKANKLKQTRIVGTSNSTVHQQENNFANRNNIEQNNFANRNSIDHLRDEVWIFYRKNTKMFKVMITDQNEIIDLTPKPQPPTTEVMQIIDVKHSKFSLNEINRTYMILFLFVHCKLYTNIGLEEFTYVHQETLSDLTTLLCHPKASSIRKENLLKCIVINIFSVHNIMEKNGHEDVIPNTALDLAIIFGMDMVGVLCKHCVHLLKNDHQISNADQYLPAIRVWMQWLITHSELVKKSSVSLMFDIWLDMCDFFNTIFSLPLDLDLVFMTEGNENNYLEEDLLMAGLKSLNNTLLYCSPPKCRESETVSELRLQNMLELIRNLDVCGNLPFVFDEKENLYKPVLSTAIASSSPVKKAKDLDVHDEVEALDDVIIEDDEDEDELGDMSHITELKTQKAALTKQIQESEFARQAAMTVLESHRLQGRHLSENSPTFLVADTNCYIDHLNYINTILRSQDFTLVVPLVVINELDGLKKGFYFDENKFHEHQRKIQECAQLAINFLEDQFSQGNSNLRAMTSNGSELDTILFRVEEFSSDRGTNDDIILSCCLRYCKECEIDTEDATRVISREVALLTSDRNLRLKAHARVVPTVDVTTFMKMARLL